MKKQFSISSAILFLFLYVFGGGIATANSLIGPDDEFRFIPDVSYNYFTVESSKLVIEDTIPNLTVDWLGSYFDARSYFAYNAALGIDYLVPEYLPLWDYASVYLGDISSNGSGGVAFYHDNGNGILELSEATFAFWTDSDVSIHFFLSQAAPQPVPEPATMILLGFGLLGLTGLKRKVGNE
jgi:hypothetical protein